MTSGDEASQWQQRITGEWYGAPSVFDAAGNHVGYEKVARASVFADGRTTYWMRTELDGGGPLKPRLQLADQFEFGVIDSDQHRIYQGPDFFGAGQPYGSLVDAHYYSPAWQADLRTMVHILGDGETQVYSSLLYDGPTICMVFNGVYRVAFDYETNDATREAIDAFTALERTRGPAPQVLPQKRRGVWTGELEVYDPDQKPAGTASITIHHEPIDLLRIRQRVEITGAIERTWEVERSRNGTRTTFHGPDVYGNAMTYGRALYSTQHLVDSPTNIRGREFLIDPAAGELSLVWIFWEGETMRHVTYGLLTWEERA
jgi:hypothetical protein